MKRWVKEKIKYINELFPAERIEKSKERWRHIWNGEKITDRYPFVYTPCLFDYYDDVHTPEERLRLSLDEFLIHGRLNDDFIPTLFPGCRQSTIPNMFGAREIVKRNDYTCERIIFKYSDIDNLPDPEIVPGMVAYEWLEMQKYFLEETEGCIPIHVVDMQGPADVAAQLFGYDNMLTLAFESPEYFHKLMSKVTDAFILFWKKQKELLGDCFVGTHLFGWSWVPDNIGASLSADSLVMISPEYYEEFYKPYFIKIGLEFGGLVVHSCGNFSHVVKNLCETPFIKGINAGQMKVEELVKAGLNPKIKIIAATPFEDVKNVFNLIRANSLAVELNILGLWPEGTKKRNANSWSNDDWDELYKKEVVILSEAMRDA